MHLRGRRSSRANWPMVLPNAQQVQLCLLLPILPLSRHVVLHSHFPAIVSAHVRPTQKGLDVSGGEKDRMKKGKKEKKHSRGRDFQKFVGDGNFTGRKVTPIQNFTSQQTLIFQNKLTANSPTLLLARKNLISSQ